MRCNSIIFFGFVPTVKKTENPTSLLISVCVESMVDMILLYFAGNSHPFKLYKVITHHYY